MTFLFTFLFLTLLSGTYFIGTKKAFHFSADQRPISRPWYHGSYMLFQVMIMCVMTALFWYMIKDFLLDQFIIYRMGHALNIHDHTLLTEYLSDLKLSLMMNREPAFAEVSDFIPLYQSWTQRFSIFSIILLFGTLGLTAYLAYRKLNPKFKAREKTEKQLKGFFFICSIVAIFITIGIVFTLLFQALHFFEKIPLTQFLFGTHWSPQTATGPNGEDIVTSYGVLPVFLGTFLISLIAMIIAVPIGIMSGIMISEYLSTNQRRVVKPFLEMLAGIPTIVYGFFAALIVAPFFRNIGDALGLSVSSESALASGIVMGIMIIPFISSMTDDALKSIPQSLRDGSLGLGATKSETIKHVVLPSALPGIAGGILLALSRAIGETMIVVMAASMAAKMSINPLNSVTTVTVQIASIMVGDQEFDSPKTLSAFALGLVLFLLTLGLNILALHLVRKYQQKYD